MPPLLRLEVLDVLDLVLGSGVVDPASQSGLAPTR